MRLKFFTAITVLTLVAGSGVAQAAPKQVCYLNDGFAVSASDSADGETTVFSVMAKSAPDETVPCPLPEGAQVVAGADDYGYFFKDLLDNHLVLEHSTGPVGDVVIIDLRDGKTVLDVSGEYDYAGADGVHYWERGEDGTRETCDRYEELTGYGLGTRILHEKILDLETGTSSDTGLTQCEGVS